jgi:hypothetical protein
MTATSMVAARDGSARLARYNRCAGVVGEGSEAGGAAALLRLPCPQCRRALGMRPGDAGRRVRCGRCRYGFTAPSPRACSPGQSDSGRAGTAPPGQPLASMHPVAGLVERLSTELEEADCLRRRLEGQVGALADRQAAMAAELEEVRAERDRRVEALCGIAAESASKIAETAAEVDRLRGELARVEAEASSRAASVLEAEGALRAASEEIEPERRSRESAEVAHEVNPGARDVPRGRRMAAGEATASLELS